MSVRENLASVRERIERAGGNPSEIAIVAVTKGFGPEICREAIDAGLKTLGENRVQEALQKMDAVASTEWHLIGHLQTNKVRLLAGRFALIQSVDSRRIAEALAAIDAAQAVLLEVNVARETQKTGVPLDSAAGLIDGVAEMLDLRGLMAMGSTNRRAAHQRSLRVHHRDVHTDHLFLDQPLPHERRDALCLSADRAGPGADPAPAAAHVGLRPVADGRHAGRLPPDLDPEKHRLTRCSRSAGARAGRDV